MPRQASVAIIGAGLAGSEAALVLAHRGISVTLFEMRPGRMTPAHTTDLPAELVCSNSLKSDLLPTVHALLKTELSLMQSPLLAEARQCRVPAGSALAVDRGQFSRAIAERIAAEPLIELVRQECEKPPDGFTHCIIAAGPLVSDSLTQWLQHTFTAESLHFYDAIAPILSADSVDLSRAFYAARWGKGEADYCNCPFTEEEYRVFYEELLAADTVQARAFEDERFFEACLPIEVIAQRGYEALLFGTMRPVGLIDPRTGRRPFAVCQLRKENVAGEGLSMVGFQTRMTIPNQKKVLRLIPGLAQADFLRFGTIHRNTYCCSPDLLADDLSFRQDPAVFLAGQLCGNEGYTESIATGHLAALFVSERLAARNLKVPPATTAIGALLRHVTHAPQKPFTPSNCNAGLIDPLPPPDKRKESKTEKRQRLCDRAIHDMKIWINQNLQQV